MTSAKPPSPPKIAPRLQLYRSELAGALIFALIAVLALAGVFDPSIRRTPLREGALSLSIEHPSLLRYAMLGRIDARITNQGSEALSEVRLTFDSDYVHAFSDVAFTPAADSAYIVRLFDIKPGETRHASLSGRAERHGLISGMLVIASGEQTIRTQLRTIMLP